MIPRYTSLPEIAQIVRREVLGPWRLDSCIASTRVGGGVLAALGIASEPLAVEVMIFNAPWVQRAIREHRMPQGTAEITRWTDECGAYSVGVGIPPGRAIDEKRRRPTDGKPWYGHLVSITEYGLMVDWSLDQASRPEYGIRLVPRVSTVPPDFVNGREPRLVQQDGETMLIYSARVADRTYQRSVDWRGRDAAVQATIFRALARIEALAARKPTGFVPR